jgi:hypothetical protein
MASAGIVGVHKKWVVGRYHIGLAQTISLNVYECTTRPFEGIYIFVQNISYCSAAQMRICDSRFLPSPVHEFVKTL